MILRKIAIDLGTDNIRAWVPGKGIVFQGPSVVVQEIGSQKIIAYGFEAKEMLGRTPGSIVALRPLQGGVIANYRATESLLKFVINKIGSPIRLVKPDVMVSIPAGVTSTERRAVVDACLSAGAKNAYIIKSPIAAALGAGIAIATPSGNMVIEIGGGTAEIGVIALGDLIAATSVRVGGKRFDQAIINSVRKKHNLVIGDQTAEQVKIKIGAALAPKKDATMEVSGSNAITGLPESIIVSTSDIVPGLREEINEIIAGVKQVLQNTPPELAADVMDKGIVMAGGASQMRDLDTLFTKVTGVPCQLAEEPELCVVKGAGIAVEHLDEYKRSLLWAK